MTDDVVDFLEEGSDGSQKKYSLTSFCTEDSLTDFKLDPQRGAKSQAALISLIGVIDADTDSAEQPVKLLLIAYVQLLRFAARHFLVNFLCCENEPDADADSVNALSNACSLIMSSF